MKLRCRCGGVVCRPCFVSLKATHTSLSGMQVSTLTSSCIRLTVNLPSPLRLVGHSSGREAGVWCMAWPGRGETSPGLGWFSSSQKPSEHTQIFAEQSDFLLFYWFGGQIGFNKRK